MLRVVVAAVLLLLAAGAIAFAVGGEENQEDATSDAGPVTGETTGLLLSVDADILTLAPEGGGPDETFVVRPVDRAQIDVDHLRDHIAQRWPVTVLWESDGGARYAIRVDDA